MAKTRKMVGLNIEETSGVDHPAHLHEGWLVIKSETSGVDDLLSDLKDKTMDISTKIGPDGIHPTGRGYQQIAKDIAK